MRKLMLVLALGLGLAASTQAADHVVSPELAQQRLAAFSTERYVDLALVEGWLSSPDARRAAKRVGVDVGQVRAAAATLSNDELRDLARRARDLSNDPVAGLDSDVRQLLVVFLIVAIVVLVLKAVD
jgi:hypothetical protein